MASHGDYGRGTRHPWPCLLFVLPFLALYEFGVIGLGGPEAEGLRNGADAWLRQGLAVAGMRQQFWAPALLLVVMLAWNLLRWGDRPGDLVGMLSGMALESVGFALGLWAISRALGPLVDHLGWELNITSANPALGQLITFTGAGIYEEMIFRLLLFSGMLIVLRAIGARTIIAVGLSAVLSAVLFSAAHHLGPNGEQLDGYTFLFRTLAGVYFAFVYQGRGFGIAVGAHACYDVIVGVTLP